MSTYIIAFFYLFSYIILFHTSLESESVSIVTSGWRFPFRLLHFRSSFFAHCQSFTGFYSLVIFFNSLW
jgi:hypothetical protein